MRAHPAPLLLSLMAGWLVSCSEPPKTQQAKEPEKPAEPVTARYAFHQIYIVARTWAPDAQGLRVTNLRVGTTPVPPGKSLAWEVTLMSPSRKTARVYTYSEVAEGTLQKGTFGGVEQRYAPRAQEQPWNIQAFKIDSDAAYETALKKSADYVKKHPDMPVTFLLEQTPRHPYLTWRVIWGTSVSASSHSIYVNASTGDYMETSR